ncbi:MAG TPA: 50S ribosomal protein L29 [Archaeoglobus profundus]|nr:50S ribosomal protein L29 [Archaeoglobus profundus]
MEEIRKMSREEKLRKLRELELELLKLRTLARAGSLDNPMKIRNIKKDIARLKLALWEEGYKV